MMNSDYSSTVEVRATPSLLGDLEEVPTTSSEEDAINPTRRVSSDVRIKKKKLSQPKDPNSLVF